MAALAPHLRQLALMPLGFLLGGVVVRLFRGHWNWDVLAGAVMAAAIYLVIALVRARRSTT